MNINLCHSSTYRSLASALKVFALAGVASVSVWGCGAPQRTVLNEEQLTKQSAVETQAMQRTFVDAIDRIMVRMVRESDTGGTMDFLALSGGGDFGAFGAGFLVGWGKIADPEWKRPEFDVVTGVSTGALISPFAFVDTDAAFEQVETFYRNPKSDWLEERGLLFFLPYNPSFMTLPGLERDVRGALNPEFIEKIAENSREGKVLAVSATNVDYSRQTFWNVGAEAESAKDDAGRKRVQDMFLASAAIPAVFPPVEIDDRMYVDGGVTANVFLRLDPKNPQGLIQKWRTQHPDKKMPKVRFWIIINNQLSAPPRTVQRKWTDVMSPSLATAIRSATVAEVRWLAAQADYTNAVFGTDIEVRVVAIPDAWRAPVEGDFKKETMDSLADLGRKLGADPTSWVEWASPKSIPFNEKHP